jgi:hypothetical protein
MQAVGILMRARGDRLSVASRAPLTDQQRAWIRAHKVELLRLLGGAVSASPKPTAEDQEANAGRAVGCGPDGGESREAAALQARHAMRVYHYRLIDKPDTWLTMIPLTATWKRRAAPCVFVSGTISLSRSLFCDGHSISLSAKLLPGTNLRGGDFGIWS